MQVAQGLLELVLRGGALGERDRDLVVPACARVVDRLCLLEGRDGGRLVPPVQQRFTQTDVGHRKMREPAREGGQQ